MPTIRQLKSKRFVAEVRKFGQYKSKTFDTKIQAWAWGIETEQTITPDATVEGKIVAELFIRYRDEICPNRKGWRREHNRINSFLAHSICNMRLADIRQSHFDDWIQEELKRVKSSSVNRNLNLFSVVFAKGVKWRWINVNPIRNIDRPKDPPSRERRINEQEINVILKALMFDGETVSELRHVVAVAFLFALETAMRQGEIWKLTWQDVYLDRCYVRLHETKNGTNRDVPLSSRAVNLLKLLKGKSKVRVFFTNQHSSGQIFRRALQLCGIKGLTFHDTRHEALTRLAKKLHVLDLARMVGHRDPRSLMIYYNPTAQEIAEQLG
ncbi:MAG: site-specific integrase [Pseudomonadota bacterium]